MDGYLLPSIQSSDWYNNHSSASLRSPSLLKQRRHANCYVEDLKKRPAREYKIQTVGTSEELPNNDSSFAYGSLAPFDHHSNRLFKLYRLSINTINTVRARTLTSVFNDRLLRRRSKDTPRRSQDSWLVEDLDAALKKDYLGPAHHVGLARVPSILNFTDAGGFDATITMIYLVPEWTSCFIVIRFLPKFCRSTTRVCDSIVWFPL